MRLTITCAPIWCSLDSAEEYKIMAELLQILERTISQNPADQQNALEFLRQACAAHYPEFVRELVTVLSNTEAVAYVRQAAGLQLKNTLVAKEAELIDVCKKRWLSLPADIRAYVKSCVLKTLGTESRPSTAAQCLAAISCIELPENQWPELIDALMTNVTNPGSSEMLKESSLESLGYICQDMPTAVMEGKANSILTAIVHGMRVEEPSTHVRLAATNALLNSLEFTRNNFENESERNIIMEVTCSATVCKDNSVKVVALQCLVKIMSLYYQFMEPYMNQALFPITLQAMKEEQDDVAMQGIEFWSNVCEEELNLAAETEEAEEQGSTPTQVSKHYAKGALQYILPILTETLAKQDDNDDDDEWIPAKAAGVCIMFLAQCCGDAIVDAILPFITEHFSSTNWHYREAAIMAFGSILEGPSKPNLLRLVEQAIRPLIVTLSDPHLAVKDTAAWSIGRVCDTCEDLVTKEEILSALLPALSMALQDQPRVAANVCWAISSLVKASYQVALEQGTDSFGQPHTFILSNVFENMIQELIKTTDRTDASNSNLRIAAYEALMELIKNSPADCYPVVQKTTMAILGKLESLLGIEDHLVSSTDKSQLRDLQSQLCATLQSVLNKIKKEDAPKISDAIMAGLLQIMRRCFGKDGGAVIEEALMAVTSLIDALGSGFEKYMVDFKPYLFAALDSHEDTQVCITAVGVLSDLCRAFEANIAVIMDEIMAKLFDILQDAKAKRNVKAHVLNIFGDIALALNAHFVRYLDSCVKWLTDAIAAAQVTNPEDYDQLEYVENLRENCCAAFAGIVQSLRSSEQELQLIRPHVNIMIHLVIQIASCQPPAQDGLISAGCALVGDLLHSFGAEMLQFVESEPVVQMLQRCRRSKLNKAKTVANWVSREVARVKRQVSLDRSELIWIDLIFSHLCPICDIYLFAMDNDEQEGYKWEKAYAEGLNIRNVLQEDESGSVENAVRKIVTEAKRQRRMVEKPSKIRLGIMRYVYLCVDCSTAMLSRVYTPQNPLSQLGLIACKDKRAERLESFSSSPQTIKETLANLNDVYCSGEYSLNSGLQLALQSFQGLPGHSSKEIILITANLATVDSGNVLNTFELLKMRGIRCSVIGLSAEMFVCKRLCSTTSGVENHVQPPVATREQEASIVRMGFPQRCAIRVASFCMCRQMQSSSGSLSNCESNLRTFYCPQCSARYCQTPTECRICGLLLLTAPQLARSHQHLQPLPAFSEVSSQQGKQCFGCSQVLSVDPKCYSCKECQEEFCIDCDELLHESLQICPSCG
uniref:Importin N-terminal domain-containing protein n=1 Tax=Ditylenchus dipsaci TaxID=166011 RepID=A0A915ELT2_9BILA